MEAPPVIRESPYRCIACGYDLSGTAIGGQCPECGRPIVDSLRSRETGAAHSTLATVSMIPGILGIALCPICGPFAILLSHMARKEISQGGYATSDTGMATAGFIMGIIGSVMLFFFGLMLLLDMTVW